MMLIGGLLSINRADALKTLRELAEVQSELAFSQIVSLIELSNNDEFAISFKCTLVDHGRKVINEFLEKKKLKMKEENGFITISQ